MKRASRIAALVGVLAIGGPLGTGVAEARGFPARQRSAAYGPYRGW